VTTYDAILYVHISAGTIALASFWTAASLRKGSGGHRTVGRTFLISMAAVAVTGAGLAVAAFSRGQTVFGTFLSYLVLITSSSCWVAWRAVRDKHDFKRFTGPLYQAIAWAQIAMGAVVLALGIRYQVLIIGALSAVGLITGAFMLGSARSEPTSRQWWLGRHYGAILGAGVGTHIAFLNLGLSHLLPPELGETAQRLSWFAPFAISLAARWWLERKYGRRDALSTPRRPLQERPDIRTASRA
jgi:hypothetical protein